MKRSAVDVVRLSLRRAASPFSSNTAGPFRLQVIQFVVFSMTNESNLQSRIVMFPWHCVRRRGNICGSGGGQGCCFLAKFSIPIFLMTEARERAKQFDTYCAVPNTCRMSTNLVWWVLQLKNTNKIVNLMGHLHQIK